MRRQERINDPYAAMLLAMQGNQSDIQTSCPAIIQSFNPSQQTCTAQPTIQWKVRAENGTYSWITLPVLVDIPVYFPKGGGFTLTFPVTIGDECLLVFANRCIDSWWYNGGIQEQNDIRMHDISDGFAFVGFSSVPNVIAGISTNSCQLRSNDNLTHVELTNGTINIISSSAVNITTPNATVTATTAKIIASETATIQAASIILKNSGSALKKLVNETFIAFFNSHVHSNGNGGANTGTPKATPASSTLTSTTQAE